MSDVARIVIAAAGFESSWMLLWGLAAVVPIVIHLWHRSRRRVENWAAMEFLVAAVKQRSRRLRVEQYALLAMRVMILVQLALILADPYWSSSTSGDAFAVRQPRHWILVFDASYSMGHQANLHSCFDVAKQRAEAIIDNSREGDGFSVVWMGQPVQTIIGRPTFDRRVVQSEIDKLSLGHQGANLSQGLSHVEAILRQTQREHDQFESHDIVFFSDLMRNTWGIVVDNSIERILNKLPPQAKLSVIDVSQTEVTANLAIADIRRSKAFVAAADRVSFDLTIRNFGSRPMPKASVDFLVDGHPVDQAIFDVPASTARNIVFRHRFQSGGEHVIAARLAADSLHEDNVRYQIVPVASSIHVLCVEGRIGASTYVRMALRPTEESNNRIIVDSIEASELRDRPLPPYHAVVMCDVPGIDLHHASLLTNYVARGGGLVICLGEAVEPSQYNAFADANSPMRLLPARLTGIAPPGQYRLDPRQYQHVIAQPFQFHPASGLLSTPIWRYVSLEPIESVNVAIPLAFENGDAAIVEETRQQARVIVVATSLSDVHGDVRFGTAPWNLWPVWPSFPPLMHELLLRVIDRQYENRAVLIGESVTGFAPTDSIDEVTLMLDAQDPVRLPVDPSTGSWSFGETWNRGIVHARYTGIDGREEAFCVNVDTSESERVRMPNDDLPERIQIAPSDDNETLDLAGVDTSGKRVLGWLYALLLISLVSESVLAWRFGQTR